MTKMGLLNKLTTGNFLFDVLLCFMLPVVMDSEVWVNLKYTVKDIWKRILTKIFPVKDVIHRNITFSYAFGDRGVLDGQDHMAGKLQKAIDLYMTKKASYWATKSQSADVTVDVHSHSLIMKAPRGEWMPVDPCTRIKVVVNDSSSSSTAKYIDVIYKIECTLTSEHIDALLRTIYNDYLAFLDTSSSFDKKRYMFAPGFSEDKSDSHTRKFMLMDRYVLSNTKTFDMLFYPEKTALLRLVDAFQEKTGKFKIAGYPYKLGFLLHGEPGTGKTSFIKALANYTNRSIVSIPLSAIKTNSQLMQLMFSNELAYNNSCPGDYMIARVDFSKVIYVIEDIDVASDVVKKRSSATDVVAKGTQNVAKKGRSAIGNDELNLAGVLNVLDGVVDTPGRIMVMTSNHPEMLDPALIRPGRINMKIHMNYMQCEEAIAMIEHYVAPMTDKERVTFAQIYPTDSKVSPATIEAMCLDADTVEQMIQKIKDLHLIPHNEYVELGGFAP